MGYAKQRSACNILSCPPPTHLPPLYPAPTLRPHPSTPAGYPGLRTQVTTVPAGADVGFTCKSTTDAVWIRESSTSFVETKFLSQGAEPFDEQIDLNKYSFGKKGNKYSLIIKDVQLSDAGKTDAKKANVNTVKNNKKSFI